MAAKTKPVGSKQIRAKALQVLAFAEQQVSKVGDWLELHFALFGVEGKANELFPTEAERAAFLRTAEYKQLLALMEHCLGQKKRKYRNWFPRPMGRSVCASPARFMRLSWPKQRLRALVSINSARRNSSPNFGRLLREPN